jgi:tetratricopeptide (TPR) repeat protein
LNTNLYAVIKQIVAKNGAAILDNSKIVNAYLSDLAPKESKAEKKAFITCLMNGFHAELKRSSEDDRRLCKNRLAQRLYDDEGLDLTLCNNTLDLLEAALFGVQPQKLLCRNCGRELQDEWNICPFCGASVKDISTKESAVSEIVSSSGTSGYGIGLIEYPSVFTNNDADDFDYDDDFDEEDDDFDDDDDFDEDDNDFDEDDDDSDEEDNEDDSDKVNGFLELGFRYIDVEEYENADEAFKRAIFIDPDRGKGFEGRAIVAARCGEYEHAISLAEDAIQRYGATGDSQSVKVCKKAIKLLRDAIKEKEKGFDELVDGALDILDKLFKL